MRKLLALGIAVTLTLGSLGVLAAVTADDLAPRVETLETQVAELRDIHGLVPTPTATPEPTATNTPEPTATNTPQPTATSTPEPTATNTPNPDECLVPDGADVWHTPTDHEHGDAPPAWANEWSCQQFGHPVIFGGDEQTPNENDLKHNAFKGYSFTTYGDDDSTVNVYARVHMQTNPHGRMARFHSCEWYFRDETGAVSLMQWWCDFGTVRYSFADTGPYDIRTMSPLNVIIGYADPSVDHLEREFWYTQESPEGDWMPAILLHVFDATTYYTYGEEADGGNPATWRPTGYSGLDREITFRWIASGSTVRNFQGQPYLTRNMENPRGWFCSTVYGDVVSVGSKDCVEGLPQHIAASLPTMGDTKPPMRRTNSVREYRNQWSCSQCALPN